jgi:hypothetical protein
MLRFYIIDIETMPLPEDELIQLMPPTMANPVMPEEIKNPVIPEEIANSVVELVTLSEEELMSGCPAYKTKAFPEGDPKKRDEYRKKQLDSMKATHEAAQGKRTQKRSEWFERAEERKMAWEEKAIENKQRFIDDAALSATTGSVKLIGIRDVVEKATYVFIAGATTEELAALNGANVKYPCKVLFLSWAEEKEMLSAFAYGVNNGNVIPANEDGDSDFRLISFYGNYFDYPFIFRRSWITGAASPWMLRKGRYFNDAISTDLLDVWQLGDRQEKVGGMDGLAKTLGTKRKTGRGEGFHRLWNESPVAALLYLLDDLDIAEEIAEKMGVINAPVSILPCSQ